MFTLKLVRGRSRQACSRPGRKPLRTTSTSTSREHRCHRTCGHGIQRACQRQRTQVPSDENACWCGNFLMRAHPTFRIPTPVHGSLGHIAIQENRMNEKGRASCNPCCDDGQQRLFRFVSSAGTNPDRISTDLVGLTRFWF